MKKIISIIPAAALIIILIFSCSGNKPVGTWEVIDRGGDTISFYKDGTFDYKEYGRTFDPDNSGTYKVKGNNEMELTIGDSTTIIEYTLNKNNHTIMIESK